MIQVNVIQVNDTRYDESLEVAVQLSIKHLTFPTIHFLPNLAWNPPHLRAQFQSMMIQ